MTPFELVPFSVRDDRNFSDCVLQVTVPSPSLGLRVMIM